MFDSSTLAAELTRSAAKLTASEAIFVVLHCHQTWPGDSDWAGIGIFRLDENRKVVEHWDVLQRVPEESSNPIRCSELCAAIPV